MDQLFTILTLGQIYIPLFKKLVEQNGIPLYPRGLLVIFEIQKRIYQKI